MAEVYQWCLTAVLALVADNTWQGTWDQAMLVAEEQLREFDLHRPEQAELLTDDQWYVWQGKLANRLIEEVG